MPKSIFRRRFEGKLPRELEQRVGQHGFQRQPGSFCNVTIKRSDDRVERDQNRNQKNPSP